MRGADWFRLPLIAAALSLWLAQSASAVPITVPTGLNPGDQYRLAFVTSTTRDATSSNIADYNAFVTGVANTVPELVALGTTWTAIASTSTVDARDNTLTNPSVNGTGVAIYLLNDTKLAGNNADLWDGSILTPLIISETGDPVTPNVVWTGTYLDGRAGPGGPLGQPGPPGVNAQIGFPDRSDAGWIYGGVGFNSNSLNLYAISGILPSTPIPEPNTSLLVFAGLLGLAGWRRACLTST